MKTRIIFSTAILATAVGLGSSASAADSAQTEQRVEVVYTNPEKFTDVKDSSMQSERARDDYLRLLKEHLQERVPQQIPEGTKLTITISDVDMAGDFEPWRGVQFHDVRIVKEIYPPRINLSYKLTDASGAVIKEGEEQLRDTSFMLTTTPIPSNDSLRYEKALLDNWLRREFTKAKKKK